MTLLFFVIWHLIGTFLEPLPLVCDLVSEGQLLAWQLFRWEDLVQKHAGKVLPYKALSLPYPGDPDTMLLRNCGSKPISVTDLQTLFPNNRVSEASGLELKVAQSSSK